MNQPLDGDYPYTVPTHRAMKALRAALPDLVAYMRLGSPEPTIVIRDTWGASMTDMAFLAVLVALCQQRTPMLTEIQDFTTAEWRIFDAMIHAYAGWEDAMPQ